MKRIKQLPYLILLFALASCGNSKSINENSAAGIKGSGTDSNLNTELPASATNDLLDKAKNEGKPVFLVVTGTAATEIEKATIAARDASNKVPNSLVYSLDKDNTENSELVIKYGIATVPVPFLLVISRKGIAVAGGQPDQMTTEQMIQSIPSPKQDEVYMALNEKRPVFMVVSQKNYSDKVDALANCKKASARNHTKPAIVEIDFDDQGEKAFLSKIGISSIKGTTVIVVSNAAGQIVETFSKKPTTNQLNAAANKTVPKSSGCCPSSSKGCG